MAGCGKGNEENEVLQDELHKLDILIKDLAGINRRIGMQLDSMSHAREVARGVRRIEKSLAISERYRLFDADSSLHYADAAIKEAEDLGEKNLEIRGRLERVSTLAAMGIFTEAREEYRRFSQDSMPGNLLPEYYLAGRTLFGYITSYLSDTPNFSQMARRRYMEVDDSLISILPATDAFRDFLIGERYVDTNQLKDAEQTDLKILSRVDSETRLYAMTAYQLANCYRLQGETEKMQLWLARSAAADLKVGVRDGLALPALAHSLYSQGNLEKAFTYITVALQDAAVCGVRWRTYAISEMAPSIANAYNANISSQKNKYLVYSAIATVCLLVSLGLLWFAVNQRIKLRRVASQLDEKSRLQNSYIGNFVAMCATYAEKLNSMTSIVDRKLSAGDTEGLRKMIKSGKFTAANNEEFYTVFDNAFLDIYPDFVNRLNSLLREEERLEWRPGKGLTPEMRIYALVCLGVVESTRIAQILQYSVSTVYAYRNRMRNRALERESFESEIQTSKSSAIP